MLSPRGSSASRPRKSWAPDLDDLDRDLFRNPRPMLGEGPNDSEFSHQRFRNFLYVEFVGPRKTLIKLRNLCLDWLQPETHTKEEIVELLVLEQFLTILPERIKPWVQAKRPQTCERLVSLLETYKEMYEPEGVLLDNSAAHSEGSLSRRRAESPPPRAACFYRDRDRDWDQDWDRDRDRDWDAARAWDLDAARAWDLDGDRAWDRDGDGAWDRAWERGRAWERARLRERERRARSRDLGFRERWPHHRLPRSRFPHRDLSLPVSMERTLATERARRRRSLLMDYDLQSQEAVTYQDVVRLTEDRKTQNSIKDNMENYRKLLFLGVQLAEDDGHSHMTQGHSRSKRSAYPGTSRGLRMPEAKKSTHRRGICEEEASHGVIMEKFKDVPRNSRSGRARDSNDRLPRFPRRPDLGWREAPFGRRVPVAQERGCEGNACGGGFNCSSSLVSRKRILERKRRYHFDTDEKGSIHDQRGCPPKRPFECSVMRKSLSLSSLSPPSAESQPFDFAAMPYVCDECGRAFGMISQFVEHQIMHTRENLYEYGESFIHSVAVSEVQKSIARGKCFECKECGANFEKTADLAEHCRIHFREYLAARHEEEYEEPFMPSPTFSELQRMYGEDKFYECKVCKETFLQSSALVEHQKKAHGIGDRDDERREAFKLGPAFNDLQKMYAKEKMYGCDVCWETFRHSSSLKEHQKIHARANLFGSKSKACAETFIPGQSLRRRPNAYSREKLYDLKDVGGAFRPSSYLSDHPRIYSRNNLYESRGFGRSVMHSGPFTESRKSHTITRPPEDEGEKAFTISSNPDDNQKFPTEENVLEGKPKERSAIYSLPFAEAQKCHSVGGPSKPKVIAESATQSSIAAEQKAQAGETSEGKQCETSATQSSGTFKRPKSPSANEWNEKRGFSIYISNPHKQQKPPARANPNEEGKNSNYKGFVIRRVSGTEPPKGLVGEGASEFKKGGQSSVSNSNVREHQKARAKKNNIEHRNIVTSVIHPLYFSKPQAFLFRDKFYECPECGESFIRACDLTEHQKIHRRKKPFGSKTHEQSVIRSLASTEPQTSYADQSVQTRYHQEPEGMTCIQQPVPTRFPEEPVLMSCVEEPLGMTCTQQPDEMTCTSQPEQMTCTQQPEEVTCTSQPEEMTCTQQPEEVTCTQQPEEVTCTSQPEEVTCTSQPDEMTCTQQPEEVTCTQQPEEVTCTQQPEEVTCTQQPEEVTCTQQPEEVTCTQQPEEVTCTQQPEEVTCTQQPEEVTCTQQPEMACTQQPEEVTCTSQPEEMTCTQQPEMTCTQQPEEVTCTSQPEEMTCTQQPEMTCTSQPEEVTCTQQPEEVTCIQQSVETSFLEELVQMSYVEEPVQSYAQALVGMNRIQQPEQTGSAQQPVGTSPAEQPRQTNGAQRPVQQECKDCGDRFATVEDLGAHQKIYAQDTFHGDSVIQVVSLDGPEQEESEQEEVEEDSEDSIYGCKDCGLGFADRADLKDHQKVHGREYLIDTREYTHSVVHTDSVSEYQRDNTGEQLFECPACGESFVHSSFLFEHQKVHEQDPYYGQRRYEPFMHPFIMNPQRVHAPWENPATGMYLQCHVCGQDFIHGSVFNEHLAVHMGENPAEQAQRSAGAGGAGLALTELQRSQAEEQHHDCETCGESFLSQADLRDHKRVHEKDDEPYDYGASFVHTSFLTEPPKGESPFFECKDCGKSFIHSTVLTKHQKLHAEEEEAAAQEVEANVLVPREVLRIQGSNMEAAEPEVEAAEPNVEAAEPNGEAEGPAGEAAEPNGEAEQPNGEAEQPNGEADEPDGAAIGDPEEGDGEPEGKAEEPEGDAREPDGAEIEDPEEEGEDQEIQVEEPYYDCRECGETFATNSAYGEHLKTHARVIIFEPGSVCGESSRCPGRAGGSSTGSDGADDKYFKCDVCGQLFGDRLSLARHQNTHTG